MTRLSQMFRPALFGLAALLADAPAQAQLVETVKDYVITIEENSSECDAARNVGDLCGPELNVVYLGDGLSGRKLFTTDVTLVATSWNDGMTSTTYMSLTNIMSGARGAQNTTSLVSADANTATSGVQSHRAAAVCANLTHGGFDDWYLPSALEAYLFFRNAASIPVSPGTVWTSSEYSQTAAYAFETGTGALTPTTKSTTRAIQCVRSGTVAVTPSKPCETVTTVGETCGTGGVIYAGPALSGEGLFATAFPLPAVTWNNGMSTTSDMAITNVQSGVNGAANTTALAVRDADTANSGTQVHAAAEYCENMTYGGYSDWYLPASAEAHTLFLNKAALPVKTGAIWTSSEYGQTTARGFDIGTGASSEVSKSTARSLICVRRGPVPAQPESPCDGLTSPGQTCGAGDVVLAGESVDGGYLFTTAFQLPAHAWNDGMTSTPYMTLTNLTSGMTGSANTAALAAADANTAYSLTQPHAAAEVCASLVYGGYSDWYLPASIEAAELHRNRGSLPVSSGVIWTSTETGQTTANAIDIATGALASTTKSTTRAVQCVRKSAAPLVAATDCDDITAVGGVCGNGNIILAGESLSGGRLYTTTVQMPAVTWNAGMSNTTYMTMTNVMSGTDGAANTAALLSRDSDSANSGAQAHVAAESCANMSYGGYSDWHLPAAHEAYELHRNRALLPTAISSGAIWTSTETGQTAAQVFDIGAGSLTPTTKSSSRAVQCVRREAITFTAQQSCDGVSAVGDTCGSGTVVYAGPALSGEGLFTTTFPLPGVTWNSGMSSTTYMSLTNVQSGVNGEANSAALAVRDADTANTGAQIHAAAEACHNMVYGGYSDWYLPGSAEIHTLFLNKGALPVKTGAFWTSSEYGQTAAMAYDLGTGATSAVTKSNARALMCVRRGPVPAQEDAPCDGLTGLGQTCGSGDIVMAGESVDGGPLFTTAFSLPAHPWNDGLSSTTYMTVTGRTSGMTGAANTAALAVADANSANALTQTHAAAEVCASLVYGGYSDWHLPASLEAAELHRNRSSLPVGSGVFWTSTETGQTIASAIDLATGAITSTTKNQHRGVQCVRKGAAALVAATDCAGVTAVGGLCGNGRIVFAGEALSGGRIYTTTVQMPAVTWNAGMSSTTYMTMTNVMSGTDGAANTAALLLRDSDSANSGTQAHIAAESCASMSYGGYDDWYLPASHEAYELHRNRALLPTAIASGAIWTSTETGQTAAQVFDIGAGSLTPTTKSSGRAVQCVRREAITFTAQQSCDGVSAVGDTCGSGTVVYAGPALSGEGLFTTTFPLPGVTWNSGMSSTTYMA
ncbi:DUF1566 domain-containing protein, partial [Gemmobacter caeni]